MYLQSKKMNSDMTDHDMSHIQEKSKRYMLRFLLCALIAFVVGVTAVFPTAVSASDGGAVISPKNVTAKDAKGYDKIKVSWSKVSGATSYTVYMAGSKNGKFKAVKTTKKTSCKISGLTTGKRKYFLVKTNTASSSSSEGSLSAQSADGSNSDGSTVVSAVPMLDKTTLKTYLITGTKVTIKWKKVTGASGYRIYERMPRGNWKHRKTIRNGSKTKYVRKNVKRKTKHTYKVVPYRIVTGKKVNGFSTQSKIYVPRKLTRSTKTFKYTRQAKVLKTARKKLGKPYVWGASGPNRFDCSGFTYWVMKRVGVKGTKFPRLSSRGIYKRYYKKYGVGRTLSKAQPGDILLYGHGRSARRIFHVGIYYGNGYYIHATTGGRGVTITKVPTGLLVGVVRMPGLK